MSRSRHQARWREQNGSRFNSKVDGKLVAMNYGLRQRLPALPPGQHVVQVEFVAADHAPFEPRVLTQAAFQVTK